jgi:hypothetical protein
MYEVMLMLTVYLIRTWDIKFRHIQFEGNKKTGNVYSTLEYTRFPNEFIAILLTSLPFYFACFKMESCGSQHCIFVKLLVLNRC